MNSPVDRSTTARREHRFATALIFALLAIATIVIAPSASAFPPAGTVTTYPGITNPSYATQGPDGAMWVTSFGTNSLSRMTTSGTVTATYTGNAFTFPTRIVTGGDGNLWFLRQGQALVRMTTAGVTTEFTGPAFTGVVALEVAADGTLWIGNYQTPSISHIDLNGNVLLTRSVVTSGNLINIAVGANGTVYFADQSSSIGVVAPNGQLSTIQTPLTSVSSVATDPDGSVWFSNNSPSGSMGRVAANGSISIFAQGQVDSCFTIARDVDGAFWCNGANAVTRVDAAGTSTQFPTSNATTGVTSGPNRTMWFPMAYADLMAQISMGDPPVTPTTSTTAASTDPNADVLAPAYTG